MMTCSNTTDNRRDSHYEKDAGNSNDVCEAARPVYDASFFTLALCIAAVWLMSWLWTDIYGLVLLAIFGLTLLFGCWLTRRATLCVLPAMYLPYTWFALAEWRAGDWCETGARSISKLWYLPGGWAGWLFGSTSEALASVATLLIFFTAVILARPSFRAASLTAAGVFVGSWLLSAWFTT